MKEAFETLSSGHFEARAVIMDIPPTPRTADPPKTMVPSDTDDPPGDHGEGARPKPNLITGAHYYGQVCNVEQLLSCGTDYGGLA